MQEYVEYEDMISPNENLSSVAIASRAKGPPAITVRVANIDPDTAAKTAQGIFDNLTDEYDLWYKERQARMEEADD